MAGGARTALLLLAAAFAAKYYTEPALRSVPPGNDCSLLLGWVQALDAKASGQTCFCADSDVRVLVLHGKPTVAQVALYRQGVNTTRVNVTTSGKVYNIHKNVDAHVRTAGSAPQWTLLSKEASACVQICDLNSEKRKRYNYSLSMFTSTLV